MLTGSAAFYTIITNVLHDLADALAITMGGRPSRIVIMPGGIAWDECGADCGSLIASLGEVYLTDTFPHMGTIRNPVELSYCRASWMVGNFVIQILRCAPVPQGNELTVSDTALAASAQVVMSDACIVLDNAACSLQRMKDIDMFIDYSVSNSVMQGPEGGCVGSELSVSIALDRGA